jgi:hypothetical protein
VTRKICRSKIYPRFVVFRCIGDLQAPLLSSHPLLLPCETVNTWKGVQEVVWSWFALSPLSLCQARWFKWTWLIFWHINSPKPNMSNLFLEKFKFLSGSDDEE